MKRATNGAWVHCACALWLPLVSYLNTRAMEPVGWLTRDSGVPRCLKAYAEEIKSMSSSSAASAAESVMAGNAAAAAILDEVKLKG